MVVYCLCKWIFEDSFLRVSFTDSITNIEKDESIFKMMKNILYSNSIEFIKRDFKKKHIRFEKINEKQFRIDFMIFGDISLNFIKIKESISDLINFSN